MTNHSNKARRKMAKETIREKLHNNANRSKESTSLYFLLWSAFTAMALIIVLIFSFTQYYVVENTYERELAVTMAERGQRIENILKQSNLGGMTGEERDAFVHYLGTSNDVTVYILDGEGKIVSPLDLAPNTTIELRDFTAEVQELINNLHGNIYKPVLYSNGVEYVYGARLEIFPNQDSYLYVCRPLDFINQVMRLMAFRVLFLSVFVFILAFAISSGVSGILVRPLTAMTKNASKLAQGDFEVDFMESAYGSEILELAQSLNFARDELSKADKMQKELIANVSHDFKTPLTMIKSYASMIREISGDNPVKRNKHAQVIEDEADRLASLVNDMLELSKIRSGIDVLKIVEFDLSAYLMEILERFTYLSDTQGYVFKVDVEEGLYTVADELKIGQVLYNLIGNAVNYTGDDKQVFVSLKRENGNIRFAVTDTGKGIKEEEISTIWDRYYRSQETHKRPVRGTGLGLSIVKSILEKHNFIFGVNSVELAGSTFYVVFPEKTEADLQNKE